MAKRNEETIESVTKTSVEPVVAPIGGELTTIPQDLLAHAGAGTENIRKEDIRPARLRLAQSMSPQVKKSDNAYIKGLEEGGIFNDLSREIYPAPLRIVVVSMLGAKGIEFAPMSEGGRIIDSDVPLDDPRMEFTQDPEDPTRRVRPIATKFFDYLVWLPDTMEFMAFSMKGSQLKVGTVLNSLLKQPLRIGEHIMMDPPSWARCFQLGTAPETDGVYTWYNFTIRPDGITPEPIRRMCSDLHRMYAQKNVIIDREPEEAREPGSDSNDL